MKKTFLILLTALIGMMPSVAMAKLKVETIDYDGKTRKLVTLDGIQYLQQYDNHDQSFIIYKCVNTEEFEYDRKYFWLDGDYRVDASISNVAPGAFKGSKITKMKVPEYSTKVGREAFYNCKDLEYVSEMYSLRNIGAAAFYGCDKLTDCDIIGSATNIGDSAFYDCKSLPSIRMREENVAIGNYAFANCESLNKIEWSGLKSIGEGAFLNCKSLTSIAFPEGFKFKPAGAAKAVDMEELDTFLASMVASGKWSAEEAAKSKEAVLKNQSTPANLGQDAFAGCTSLSTVLMDYDNKQYEDVLLRSVFRDCPNVKLTYRDAPDTRKIAARVRSFNGREWNTGLYYYDDKGNVVNEGGKLLVNTSVYEVVGFSTEAIVVKKNGKLGALNYNGKLVVPCQYSRYVGSSEYRGGRLMFSNPAARGEKCFIYSVGGALIASRVVNSTNQWSSLAFVKDYMQYINDTLENLKPFK